MTGNPNKDDELSNNKRIGKLNAINNPTLRTINFC